LCTVKNVIGVGGLEAVEDISISAKEVNAISMGTARHVCYFYIECVWNVYLYANEV